VNRSKKTVSIISLILFILGTLLGTIFIALASWGGMEGMFFDHVPNTDRILTSLNCPMLISTRETAQISATITNSSKYMVNPEVIARISAGHFTVYNEFSERHMIEPKSSVKLNWQATVEDATYGQKVILVHVKVLSSYPLPAMNGNCGIIVLNIGALSGKVVITSLGIIAMILVCVGWWFWYRSHPVEKTERSQRSTNGLRVLGLIVIGGILASFFRLWFLGILALGAIVLLAVILFSVYAAVPKEEFE